MTLAPYKLKGKTKVFDGGLDISDESPKYMGIDQSYHGFAVTLINESGKYKTWVYAAGGRGVTRLIDIYYFLGETIFEVANNVEYSAMEGYAYGAQMAHMAGELGGMVKLELHSWMYASEARYPYIVAPSMVKKYVTGVGTGVKKNQMLLNTFKKWGVEFTDDNAADSYALARIAGSMGDLAYEKDIIKKLLDPKFREKP
jgi:Holliday junction resolvasome RuvABC endonuclease subunit